MQSDNSRRKFSTVREEREALEVELDGALDALKYNEQVLVGAEKRVEDFRVAASSVIHYLAPTPVGVEVEGEDQVLDQLRAASEAMHALETSSARECVVRALSMLRLHYPQVDMR